MSQLVEIKDYLNKDLPIYVSNKVIEAHFALPLGEQRLLYAYISKLNEDHIEFPELEISVKEFSKLLDVEINYKAVRNTCKKLLERVIEIETEDEWIGFQWFSLCRYKHREGRLKLKIHDELKPYLLRLKKEFTRLITRQVMQFKSVYSIRIYMLCKQYQSLGKRKIKLDELRKKLGIPANEYRLYADFKKRVINQATKEINALSDIEIDFEEEKTGRKITAIKFLIYRNDKNEIKERGIAILKLKNTEELAEMLSKEAKKRWKCDLPVKDITMFSSEAMVELLCTIYRGVYEESIIETPALFIKTALMRIEAGQGTY